MLRHFFILGSTLLALSQCGGRKLGTLDAKQSSDFKDTVSAFERSFSATQKALLPVISEDAQSLRSVFLARRSSMDWLGLETKSSTEDLKAKLKTALQNAKCEKTVPEKIDFDGDMVGFWGLKDLSLTFSVRGGDCPVDYEEKIDLHVDRDARYLKASHSRNLELKQEELKALSEIQSLKLSSDLELRFGRSLTTDLSKGSWDVKGSFVSKERGELGFYLNLKGEGIFKDGSAKKLRSGDGELRFGIEFKDFTGEIKVVAKQLPGENEPSLEYFVNDRSVSEKEIASYFKGGMGHSSSGGTQSAPTESPHK